jgi:hypothetical protein
LFLPKSLKCFYEAKKNLLLLHRSKNSLTTRQTRLAGDLTENLASDLVAKKLGYCSKKKSYAMVAKSDHIIEMDGDFVGDLKNYAIVAIPQYDCSIIMLPMMQIHKYVAEKKSYDANPQNRM